jgi:hypothetical protein
MSDPEPTIWPAAIALASVLVLWGTITSLIMTAVGAVLFVIALGGWIGELRHDQ